MTQSAVYSSASTGGRSESGNGNDDFMKLLCQSYFLCFNDEHASFPHTLYKLFKGDINRTMDSGDFVSSADHSVL